MKENWAGRCRADISSVDDDRPSQDLISQLPRRLLASFDIYMEPLLKDATMPSDTFHDGQIKYKIPTGFYSAARPATHHVTLLSTVGLFYYIDASRPVCSARRKKRKKKTNQHTPETWRLAICQLTASNIRPHRKVGRPSLLSARQDGRPKKLNTFSYRSSSGSLSLSLSFAIPTESFVVLLLAPFGGWETNVNLLGFYSSERAINMPLVVSCFFESRIDRRQRAV